MAISKSAALCLLALAVTSPAAAEEAVCTRGSGAEAPGCLAPGQEHGEEELSALQVPSAESFMGKGRCKGYPTLAGQKYTITNYQLTHDETEEKSAGAVSKTSHPLEFVNQVDKDNNADDNGKFVMLKFNDGQAYFLCMFTDTYVLACWEAAVGGFMETYTIDKGSINPKTCAPKWLTQSVAYGWVSHPSTDGGSMVRKDIMEYGDLVQSGTSAPASTSAGAWSGWGLCKGYPKLTGTKYTITNYQLTRDESEDKDAGAVTETSHPIEFFNQVDKDNNPDDNGKFVMLNFNDGQSYFLCMFTDTYKFSCWEAAVGAFSMHFTIKKRNVCPLQCVVKELTQSIALGWVEHPPAPDSGATGMLRKDIVEYGELVRSSESALQTSSRAAQVGDKGASLKKAAASAAAEKGTCFGYPKLAGQKYTITNYQLTHDETEEKGAGAVSETSHPLEFFNQVDKDNNPDDHGKFVQMNFNDNQAYFLCMFTDTFELTCTETAAGSLTEVYIIDPTSLCSSTCVPKKILQSPAYGNVVHPSSDGSSMVRKDLMEYGDVVTA